MVRVASKKVTILASVLLHLAGQHTALGLQASPRKPDINFLTPLEHAQSEHKRLKHILQNGNVT